MRTINCDIVVGLGFGDEGKGNVTHSLVKNNPEQSVVVRFSGGPNAGHRVVSKSFDHTFSSFGSGTHLGVPTYWSEYCPVNIDGMLNEYSILAEKGVTPILYVNGMCPVTTPFDVEANHFEESKNRHGSVGVGQGTTMKRHHNSPVKLYVKDLLYPEIVKNKLKAISIYYGNTIWDSEYQFPYEEYQERIVEYLSKIKIVTLDEVFGEMAYQNRLHFVFEGSQGVMLDMNHGVFPNVTYSSTTSKNALQIIESLSSKFRLTADITIQYITRCYGTRHGHGPQGFSKSVLHSDIKDTEPAKGNFSNQWQGDFKYFGLHIDDLNYAISSDIFDRQDSVFKDFITVLNITCLDHVSGVTYTTLISQIVDMIKHPMSSVKGFCSSEADEIIYLGFKG